MVLNDAQDAGEVVSGADGSTTFSTLRSIRYPTCLPYVARRYLREAHLGSPASNGCFALSPAAKGNKVIKSSRGEQDGY